LQECRDKSLIIQIIRGCGEEYLDTPHPFGLLRMRRQRPGDGTTDKAEKLASPHGRPTAQDIVSASTGALEGG
jgi:hypothetical protein